MREDATFEDFMTPDENGTPRLYGLLDLLVTQGESFFLIPTREIFPHNYDVGSSVEPVGKHVG